MIRVALAEDHTLVRDGIRTLLGLVSDIELVGEAADGEETLRVVEAVKPDVLLLDMRMPRGDGRHVVGELARRGILPPTLILTTFDDEEAALDVIAAGARGFLLKDIKLDTLVQAVRTVAAGGTRRAQGRGARVRLNLCSARVMCGAPEPRPCLGRSPLDGAGRARSRPKPVSGLASPLVRR